MELSWRISVQRKLCTGEFRIQKKYDCIVEGKSIHNACCCCTVKSCTIPGLVFHSLAQTGKLGYH